MALAIGIPSLPPCLTRERLVEVGRLLGVDVPTSAKKERQVEALLAASPALPALVDLLHRDELKTICREHGLAEPGRARLELVRRVLEAAGEVEATSTAYSVDEQARREVKRPGDGVRVRHRQYLLEEVSAPARPKCTAGLVVADRVRQVDLDDDCQGRPLAPGARLRNGYQPTLLEGAMLRPARVFRAFLATPRWLGVAAAAARGELHQE